MSEKQIIIPSIKELRKTIQNTSDVMSCEGKTVFDLLELLEKQRGEGMAEDNWILEIDVLNKNFEIRKLKFNTETTPCLMFKNYCFQELSSNHTILKVMPVKH